MSYTQSFLQIMMIVDGLNAWGSKISQERFGDGAYLEVMELQDATGVE